MDFNEIWHQQYSYMGVIYALHLISKYVRGKFPEGQFFFSPTSAQEYRWPNLCKILFWTFSSNAFSCKVKSDGDIKGVQIYETNLNLKSGIMDFNGILASAIQSVREISAVIVTDDYRYLCYKEQKSPYNFFHILIFTNYLILKLRTNDNIQRRVALLWSGRTSTSCLGSHTDPFVFCIAFPLLSG